MRCLNVDVNDDDCVEGNDEQELNDKHKDGSVEPALVLPWSPFLDLFFAGGQPDRSTFCCIERLSSVAVLVAAVATAGDSSFLFLFF